jgi:hypothetical protein
MPEQTSSLVVATSVFEHSSVSANLYKDSLSTFPFRLNPISLAFPDARGHVRDVWQELRRSRFRVGL